MPPKYSDLKRYCEKNRWVLIRNTDHWYYEKVLTDGTVLRTKVSHPVQKEIPGRLWKRILKMQLKIGDIITYFSFRQDACIQKSLYLFKRR